MVVVIFFIFILFQPLQLTRRRTQVETKMNKLLASALLLLVLLLGAAVLPVVHAQKDKHFVASLQRTATTSTTRTTRGARRGLQATTYLTYTTTSDVQEEALVDLDVLALGAQLAINTVEGLDNALIIYEDGRSSDTSLSAPAYTLQSLSSITIDSSSATSMIEVHQLYQDYYGVADYANQWILGAFKDDDSTASTFTNGRMDFSLLTDIEAQGVAIETAVVVMSIWMTVVQHVYEAIDRCNYVDTAASLNNWDQAVAFYTGSTVTEPTIHDQGALLYSLAQTHCKTFGTCHPVSGMAKVNTAVYADFNVGKENLLAGKCLEAKANAESILRWMQVPLIQGTLASVYTMDLANDDRQTTRAQGAAYGAAILPLLDKCNANYTALVYRDMDLAMSSLGSFEVVKDALESQYGCLRVTCADVGGIVDLANPGKYIKDAEPCGYAAVDDDEDEEQDNLKSANNDNTASSSNSSSKNNVDVGLAVGLLVALAVVLILIGVMVCCLCRRSRRRKGGASDATVFAEPKPNPGIT
jgi:hypothetical protein